MTNPTRKRVVTLDDLNVLNQNAAYARQKGEEASAAAQQADTARQNLEALGGDTQAAGQQATQAAQAATLAKNSATAAALQASQAAGDAVTAAELAEGAAGTANQAAGVATMAAQRVTDAVLDLTDIKVDIAQTELAVNAAAAEALSAAGISPAYISETTADPAAAPDGTRGAKRLADGSLQRLERVASAWVARGSPLLTRGSTREVLTSWYPTIEAALESGAGVIWLDDLKTCTTTLEIPASVRLLDRGGTLEFPSGTPNATGGAINLVGDGSELGDGLKIRVTGGAYSRGVQPRANNVTIGSIDLIMSNTITTPGVNSFGLLLSHSVTLTGLRVRNPKVKIINHARPMVVSVGNCPDAVIGDITVYDTVATAPNKLDWCLYLAQNCDGLRVNSLTALDSNIGGFHSNDGAGQTSRRKSVGRVTVKNIGFIGFAAETFANLTVGSIHVDGAGLPMALGQAGISDTGATIGPIYLANVISPLGADAEMLQLNADDVHLNVTFGPAGAATRGALILGQNARVTAKFSGRRPVIAAEIRATGTNSEFVAEVPELHTTDLGTTQSAVTLAAPGSVFRGSVRHSPTATTYCVVASGNGARVINPYLEGTGYPVLINTGAVGVRVERAVIVGFSGRSVRDLGTNSFIDVPQTTAELSPARPVTRTWVNKTTNYQMVATDDLIRALTAGITITLPDISTVPTGRTYTIKSPGAGSVIVSGAATGQNIDGALTVTVTSLAAITVMYRAAGWDIISRA